MSIHEFTFTKLTIRSKWARTHFSLSFASLIYFIVTARGTFYILRSFKMEMALALIVHKSVYPEPGSTAYLVTLAQKSARKEESNTQLTHGNHSPPWKANCMGYSLFTASNQSFYSREKEAFP